MTQNQPDTDALVQQASLGSHQAMEQLMDRHRARLRNMVMARMDPRLASRVDPSDVVQETLALACRRLPDYARERPLPFYPWLRQMAWDRLMKLNEHHIQTQKRSVTLESPNMLDLSDHSVQILAEQMFDKGSTPSQQAVREEMFRRARTALASMEATDREVLVMRHLEQMQISDISVLLGISEAAVKMRRLRAIQRLRQLLVDDIEEDQR